MSQVIDDVVANYMAVFFAAFAVSIITTPMVRAMAVRHRIVDWPDASRKSHVGPIAYLGGVAIFLGWMAGVVACHFLSPAASGPVVQTSHMLSVIFGAICITVTGLVDDLYGISPRVKIGGQLVAAGGLAWGSQSLGTVLVANTLRSVGIVQIDPVLAYIVGAVLLAVFVIGGCNAVNLLDGLDGLAAGVCTIACVGFLAIAVIATAASPSEHDPVRIVMCLAMLGALLGFLPYNFNPANIFLGDAGSLLLGYLSVATILMFADRPKMGPMLVMAAIIVFALPITDTALAIFRRKLRGHPIFSPDDQHIHHQLLRVMRNAGFHGGMAVKMAVIVMYLQATLFAVLGCALVFMRWRFVMAIFFPLFGFIVVTAYKLGHRQVANLGPEPGENPATAPLDPGPGTEPPDETAGGRPA